MAQASFSAAISKWAAETKERMVAVRNTAAERVVDIMQTPVALGGNMPVRDGFLRGSLMATTGNLPPTKAKPEGDAKYTYDPGQLTLVLADARLTETITVAYQANYARYQEYGSRGRPGRRFAALAAQQWPAVVAAACADIEKRVAR